MTKSTDPRVLASRTRIAAAAQSLFSTHGYVGTTIADIAERADVAVQTVYNAVGSKAAVLNLVLDTTAAGDHAPVPVATFMQERTSKAGDAIDVVDMLADWFAELHPRTVDVFRVIHEAAAIDTEIAALRARRDRTRLDNYGRAARAIIERGGGGDVSEEELAATIWSLGHPTTFAMLVVDCGWPLKRYREWLGNSLRASLHAHGPPSHHPDGEAVPKRVAV